MELTEKEIKFLSYQKRKVIDYKRTGFGMVLISIFCLAYGIFAVRVFGFLHSAYLFLVAMFCAAAATKLLIDFKNVREFLRIIEELTKNSPTTPLEGEHKKN